MSNASRPVVEIGSRFAEFVTIDAMLLQLELLGLPRSEELQEQAITLRSRVTASLRDVEVVGSTDGRGRRLHLLLPDGRLVVLRPDSVGPPEVPHWGDVSASTVDVARLLIRRVHSRRWGPDEEMLALALVHNFLGRAGSTFSLTANSLSDWCLFDAELETALDLADLAEIARRASSEVGFESI